MQRIIAIGGVAAGTSAVAKARRVDPQAAVELYTEEPHISYGACGFPHYIAGEIPDAQKLIARRPEAFREQGIEVQTRWRAHGLDPQRKIVWGTDLENGQEQQVAYDNLILSTGASSIMPPWPGIDLEGVFPLRKMQDALAIRRFITEARPRQAVIVGAGYISIEMVEALHRLGLSVSVVEMNSHILPNMDADMAQILQDYLVGRGIKLHTGERVQGFEGAQQKVTRVQTERRTLPADLVLVAVGVRPDSELGQAAGLELGAGGAIRVNQRMETSQPGIYAAGDCATTRHLVTGEEIYLPLGTTANKQGRTAGGNAAGSRLHHQGVVGTAVARVLDYEFSRTGLSEKECRYWNQPYHSERIKSRTQAGYLPGSGEIHVKVLMEPSGKKMLGAQMVGRPGTGKRIDVFATALTLGATVDDLHHMDLAYAPPFSPVYDPILIALNRLL